MDLNLNLKLGLTKESIIKNKVLIIGVAIVAVSLWYGYNQVYVTTMKATQQVKADISNEGIKGEISKRLQALQKELAGYEKYFTKGKDILWLIDRVSKSANESGLKIISLNSQPSIVLRAFICDKVTVIAVGTFHQLGDFVSKIEGSKDFMRIEKISFKKTEKFLSAEIVIATYYWK